MNYRKIILILAAWFAFSVSFAQVASYNPTAILDGPRDTIPQFDLTKLGPDQFFIPTPFAEPQLLSDYDAYRLDAAEVERVALVYTTYRLVEDFDQRQLNRQRLDNLHRVAPHLFEDENIRWHVIAQDGCRNAAQGDGFFHGFIITHRPIFTPAARKAEIVLIDSMLTVFSEAIEAAKDNDTIIGFGRNRYDRVYGFVPDSSTAIYGSKMDLVMPDMPLKDSTLLKVFERNPWKKKLVVTDVTGSMASYIAQLIVWYSHALKDHEVEQFVFFNDGDDKLRKDKVIGSTGGIYQVVAGDFIQLSAAISRAMKAGAGGDIPENDVEAILTGIRDCPDCKEVILIADNYSGMRDYRLLESIKVPVHVILCGGDKEPHLQYLNLAKATRGSIHTLTEDLNDMGKLPNGATFTIAGEKYKVVNGNVVHDVGL